MQLKQRVFLKQRVSEILFHGKRLKRYLSFWLLTLKELLNKGNNQHMTSKWSNIKSLRHSLYQVSLASSAMRLTCVARTLSTSYPSPVTSHQINYLNTLSTFAIHKTLYITLQKCVNTSVHQKQKETRFIYIEDNFRPHILLIDGIYPILCRHIFRSSSNLKIKRWQKNTESERSNYENKSI